MINSLKTLLPISGFRNYQRLPGRLCYVDVRGGVKPMVFRFACGYICTRSVHEIDKNRAVRE